MRHIALMGKARSGKNTVADHLTEHYGYRQVSFAGPLKEMALKADPTLETFFVRDEKDAGFVDRVTLADVVEWDGWELAKDKNPEVRRFLQSLGSAVRDVLGEDTWINKAMESVRWHMSEGSPVVVTDVRYTNEAATLRWHGFTMIRIERPGLDSGDQHASETELDNYAADHVIVNDGSVSDLLRQVEGPVR